jgi:NAD(P)-dependent dehydrogenase (short-subunit alcohol dehydrogenase family)
VVEVNVLGVMTVLAVAARAMVAGGHGGAIVNVASMAGVSGAPNMPAYSASKTGVIGLTKAAAKDLAPAGVRVNPVSPGFIGRGRMWQTQVDSVPLRRYGSTQEVAKVVAFLLSDAASYVNGVNIEVSGGGL